MGKENVEILPIPIPEACRHSLVELFHGIFDWINQKLAVGGAKYVFRPGKTKSLLLLFSLLVQRLF